MTSLFLQTQVTGAARQATVRPIGSEVGVDRETMTPTTVGRGSLAVGGPSVRTPTETVLTTARHARSRLLPPCLTASVQSTPAKISSDQNRL